MNNQLRSGATAISGCRDNRTGGFWHLGAPSSGPLVLENAVEMLQDVEKID
jgi:hypothetical protein